MRAHPMAGDTVLAVLLGLFDLLLFAADGLAEFAQLPPWYTAALIVEGSPSADGAPSTVFSSSGAQRPRSASPSCAAPLKVTVCKKLS